MPGRTIEGALLCVMVLIARIEIGQKSAHAARQISRQRVKKRFLITLFSNLNSIYSNGSNFHGFFFTYFHLQQHGFLSKILKQHSVGKLILEKRHLEFRVILER